MPGTRRDRRRSNRRRQPEENAPSEIPPIEDPVDDPSVEIPGPAEVPESVMEAMADNISEAPPESVEEEVPEPPGRSRGRRDRSRGRRDRSRQARSRPDVVEVPVEEPEPEEEPEEVPTEDETDVSFFEAVAEEGRTELERGETRPVEDLLQEIDEEREIDEEFEAELDTLVAMNAEAEDQLDNMLNGGETIAAVSPLVEAGKLADYLRQKITDLRAIVAFLEEENANLKAERNTRPEFDEYVLTGDCRIVLDVSDLRILVPKDSTVEFKKEE